MSAPGETNGWRDGLPDLPPEWGNIVIPDDASALAEEAAQVREELRRKRTQARRRHHRGIVAVLLVAMVATLTSLYAVMWNAAQQDSEAQAGHDVPPPAPTRSQHATLPALELVDPQGATVPLRSLLPAVILMPESCDCGPQIAAASAAAPPGVTVVAVTTNSARPAPLPTSVAAGTVRALADPTNGLREHLNLASTPGTLSVVLVDADAAILRVLPASTSIEEFRGDLAQLDPRQSVASRPIGGAPHQFAERRSSNAA